MNPIIKTTRCIYLVLLVSQLASLAVTPASASDRDGLVVEPELTRVSFEDGVLSGSTYNMGITLAYAFRAHYEIGLNYSSNQIFPLVLLDTTDLDQSSTAADEDDLEFETQTLYARLNWHPGADTTVFVMIGESDYELKNRIVGINLFGVPSISDNTTYRNKTSSTSVGLGLQWRREGNQFYTLKYTESLDGDFDYSTLSLGLRFIFDD